LLKGHKVILRVQIHALWLATAGVAIAGQGARTLNTEHSIDLSVCEILSDPLRYDGHLVSIRGVTSGTSEGYWFIGTECPGIMKTAGYTWDSIIAIALPGSPLQIHRVNFEFDSASERRLRAKYDQLSHRFPKDCITWTYTGLFETRRAWTWTSLGTPRGFGHLGGAPGDLIIRSADAVRLLPKCHGH
jgi:hypothetical protein